MDCGPHNRDALDQVHMSTAPPKFSLIKANCCVTVQLSESTATYYTFFATPLTGYIPVHLFSVNTLPLISKSIRCASCGLSFASEWLACICNGRCRCSAIRSCDAPLQLR